MLNHLHLTETKASLMVISLLMIVFAGPCCNNPRVATQVSRSDWLQPFHDGGYSSSTKVDDTRLKNQSSSMMSFNYRNKWTTALAPYSNTSLGTSNVLCEPMVIQGNRVFLRQSLESKTHWKMGIACLDLKSGKKLWNWIQTSRKAKFFPTAKRFLRSVSIDGELLLVTILESKQQTLFALRTTDGSVAWKRTSGINYYTSGKHQDYYPVTGSDIAVSSDGAIFEPSGQHEISVLDKSGSTINKFHTDLDCGQIKQMLSSKDRVVVVTPPLMIAYTWSGMETWRLTRNENLRSVYGLSTILLNRTVLDIAWQQVDRSAYGPSALNAYSLDSGTLIWDKSFPATLPTRGDGSEWGYTYLSGFTSGTSGAVVLEDIEYVQSSTEISNITGIMLVLDIANGNHINSYPIKSECEFEYEITGDLPRTVQSLRLIQYSGTQASICSSALDPHHLYFVNIYTPQELLGFIPVSDPVGIAASGRLICIYRSGGSISCYERVE